MDLFDNTVTAPLIFQICFVLGITVYSATAFWLWDIRARKVVKPLSLYSRAWHLRGFLSVLIFSLITTLLHSKFSIQDLKYLPEITIITLITLIYFLRIYKKKSSALIALKFILKSEVTAFAKLYGCVLSFMAVTATISFSIFQLSGFLKTQFQLPALDPLRDCILIAGIFGLSCLIWLYRDIQEQKKSGTSELPKQFKFQNILSAFVFMLFLFMLPLLLERAVTSDKWKEMNTLKQMLEKA